MQRELRRLDTQTRRSMLETCARTALGVGLLPAADAMMSQAHAGALPGAAPAAEHVIYLFMNGAMSHLDTFDPKPQSDAGGETKAVQTAASGIQVAEHLPQLARRMNRLAVLRGMTTETGAHQQGVYLMRTSYKMIGSIRHPFMGAWMNHFHDSLNRDLPGSVIIGAANRHPGQGYLSAELAPAPVANPATGLQNTKSPGYLNERHFDKRRRLTAQFESGFRRKYANSEVQAYLDYYRSAVKLLKSPDLEAFDISGEKEEIQEAYGKNRIGQGCLLARRLVEKRVRFVEVEFGGWDNHNDLYESLPDRAGQLDQALATLMDDLQDRGLLQKTLLVLATEFGRTPKINQNAGRDHHPGAFSCALAGAGIKGGQVIGSTDSDGRGVEDGHCYPADLNATIAAACGLDLNETVYSPTNRPFKVANEGAPVVDVLTSPPTNA